jgi:hypothetical protein
MEAVHSSEKSVSLPEHTASYLRGSALHKTPTLSTPCSDVPAAVLGVTWVSESIRTLQDTASLTQYGIEWDAVELMERVSE